VVLTAPAWAVLHAFWVQIAARRLDEPAWRSGGRTARPGWRQRAGSPSRTGWPHWSAAGQHAQVEQVTMGLFGLA
jgi:hypothetical protein